MTAIGFIGLGVMGQPMRSSTWARRRRLLACARGRRRCSGRELRRGTGLGVGVPADAAELVAMLAGETEAVADVAPLLASMCRETIVCGAVPNATLTKLAVNLYLNALVVSLADRSTSRSGRAWIWKAS